MSRWFKLDNAAKIYPPIQTRRWAMMFRLSATMTEEVDTGLLDAAQRTALKRFPSFSTRLRRGLFWYYLEQLDGAPPIREDIYNPMQVFSVRENGYFMYRLLVYKKRVAVEFLHTLTDGTGGMTFLLTILNEYVRLRYGAAADAGGYILDCGEEPHPEEYEDSFLRYSDREVIGRKESISWQPRGDRVPSGRLLIVSGSLRTADLKNRASAYGVTVGNFLTALLLYSAYRVQQQERSKKKRRQFVKVSVPVNLRRFFPSRTLRNFSSYVNPGVDSRLGEYTFEEILGQVVHFMGMHVTEKDLRGRFSANVLAEKLLIVRMLPLALKVPVLRLFFLFEGDRYNASTISNLGKVEVGGELAERIDRLDFMLGRQSTRRSVCAAVSFGEQTVVNFTRTLRQSELERFFFTSLVEMGIPVTVEGNGRR